MISSYHFHTISRTLSNLIWTNLEPKLEAPNRPKKPPKGPRIQLIFLKKLQSHRGVTFGPARPPPRAPQVNVNKEAESIMIRW